MSPRMTVAIIGATLLVWTLPALADRVSVDPSAQDDGWDGWGISLSWWAETIGGWSEENRDAIADLLFDSKEGLGLNIARYNIGGQDNPEHSHMRVGGDIPSFKAEAYAPYDWSADIDQRRMLEEAIERGVNITEAFACSPPHWMTVSGCSAGAEEAGEDNLREDQYEAFADYLTEVVRHFRDAWGITFTTLAPFNEPSTAYWKAEGFQQGCHFDIASQQRLLRLVAEDLKAKGLATELSASDETCTEHCVRSIRAYGADMQSLIAQINTHTYNDSSDRAGPRYVADRLGKRLHMSEICFPSREPGREHDHTSMEGALDMARAITRDLREMRPDAWINWQALTHERYCDWWKFNYSLMHADYEAEAEEWFMTKKYYGYGQYTRFIRPGYRLIETDSLDTIAALDPVNGALVIAAYNDTQTPRERVYDLSAFDSTAPASQVHMTSADHDLARLDDVPVREGLLIVTEPARSVCTYVVDAATYTGPPQAPVVTINDDEVGDGNNQFEFLGEWDYTDFAPGAFVTDNHWSGNARDSYSIRFTGPTIRLYCAIAPNLGIMGVTLDDAEEILVDLYATEREDQHLIYESPELPPGPHRVIVRVTGEKNPEASHVYGAADKAEVVGP